MLYFRRRSGVKESCDQRAPKTQPRQTLFLFLTRALRLMRKLKKITAKLCASASPLRGTCVGGVLRVVVDPNPEDPAPTAQASRRLRGAWGAKDSQFGTTARIKMSDQREHLAWR